MQDRSDWEMRIYRNFETPDEDDLAYYRSLTPTERIHLMLEMIGDTDPERRLDRTPRLTRRPSG